VRARKILLLIGILAIGATIEATWRAREELGFGATGWRILSGEFHGPSHRFQTEEVRALSLPGVSVKNEFGSVRVVSGAAGELRVRLEKRVYVGREVEAEEFARRVVLLFSEDGESVELRTNREELLAEPGADVGFETALEIAVPLETAVRVSARHSDVDVTGVAALTAATTDGRISANGIAGPVDVQNRDGAVDVIGVEGPVTVRNRHGDVLLERIAGSVDAHVLHGEVSGRELASLTLQLRDGSLDLESLTGELQVRGSRARVSIKDARGPVDVQTSYAPVSIEDAGADVRLENRHGRAEVRRVAGALTAKLSDGDAEIEEIAGRVVLEVRDGEVRGRQLEGGAALEVWDRRVELSAFAGRVEIRSRAAEVILLPELPITDSVDVTSEDGPIRLRVPARSRFDLVAGSEGGRVDVELPDLVRGEGADGVVEGRVGGGGAAVSLRSRRGDVRVFSSEGSSGG